MFNISHENPKIRSRYALVVGGIMSTDECEGSHDREIERVVGLGVIDPTTLHPACIEITLSPEMLRGEQIRAAVESVTGADVEIIHGEKFAVEFDLSFQQVPWRIGRETARFITRIVNRV